MSQRRCSPYCPPSGGAKEQKLLIIHSKNPQDVKVPPSHTDKRETLIPAVCFGHMTDTANPHSATLLRVSSQVQHLEGSSEGSSWNSNLSEFLQCKQAKRTIVALIVPGTAKWFLQSKRTQRFPSLCINIALTTSCKSDVEVAR